MQVDGPDWQQLLILLETDNDDDGNPAAIDLVGFVAGCVETWCASLTELLRLGDDDSEGKKTYAQWTETLLEHIATSSPGTIRVFLNTSPSDEASTGWSRELAAFVISLPNGKGKRKPVSSWTPVFFPALLGCFKDGKNKNTEMLPALADDWADVGMDEPALAGSKKPAEPTLITSLRYSGLPMPNSLPRPEELLTQPPYHLVVKDLSRTRTEILSSHSQSLQLMADYPPAAGAASTTTTPRRVSQPIIPIFGLGGLACYPWLTSTTRFRSPKTAPCCRGRP